MVLPLPRVVLVESIPEGLTYDDNSTVSPSTFEAWLRLLGDARHSVDIAAFYWTLRNEDTHTQDPSASQVSHRASLPVRSAGVWSLFPTSESLLTGRSTELSRNCNSLKLMDKKLFFH